MIPQSEGVWRWKRKDDGREFDLPIFDVGAGAQLSLRVYFLGGYYDIDEMTGGEFTVLVDRNPNGRITKQIRGWVHPLDFLED